MRSQIKVTINASGDILLIARIKGIPSNQMLKDFPDKIEFEQVRQQNQLTCIIKIDMNLNSNQLSSKYILITILETVITFRVVEKNVQLPEILRLNNIYFVTFEHILLFAIFQLYSLRFFIIRNFRNSDFDQDLKLNQN